MTMPFSIVSKAYHVDGDRCGQAGFRFLAGAAHRRNLPVTWVLSPAAAALLRDELEVGVKQFGDEIAMEYPILPARFGVKQDVGRHHSAAAIAEDMRPFDNVDVTAAILRETRDAMHKVAPFAEVVTVGRGGFRTEALVRALEQEGFEGLWGFCWNQSFVDGISDRGCPWGVWYASHDSQKLPARYAGKVTAYEWISRDFTPAHWTGDPCRFAIEPDGVIQFLYGDVPSYQKHGEPGLAWFRSVIRQYQRNAAHNPIVPYVFQEEIAQLDPEYGIKPRDVALAMQKLTGEIIDDVAAQGIECLTLRDVGRRYRTVAGERTAASAMIYDSTVPPTIPPFQDGREPFKPLLFYYNQDVQAVFEIGGDRPIKMYSYSNATRADVHHDLVPFEPMPYVMHAQVTSSADGGLSLSAEVWCDFRRGVVAPVVFWGDFSAYASDEPDVRIVEDVAAIFPVQLDRDRNSLTFTLRRLA